MGGICDSRWVKKELWSLKERKIEERIRGERKEKKVGRRKKMKKRGRGEE